MLSRRFAVYAMTFAYGRNLHLPAKSLKVGAQDICQLPTPAPDGPEVPSRPQAAAPGSKGTESQGRRAATRGLEIPQVEVRQEQIHGKKTEKQAQNRETEATSASPKEWTI